MRTVRRLALCAFVLSWLTTPVVAKVVKYAFSDGNFRFVAAGFLPLNNSDATQISFNGGSGQKLIAITFSAECAAGGDIDDWVNIDILVDDVVIAPTQGDDAFCSGNDSDDADNGGWVTASRTVAKKLGPGQHTVKVRAQLQGAVEGWIGNSSLTIIN